MRIRKGKDVAIRWRIFTNGNSETLAGRDLLLELKSPFGRVFELPFRISEGNVVEAVFRGVDQQNVGFYSLTLWENKGYDGQTAVDAVRAFELVRTTDEENKVGESPDLTTETIDLGTSDITLTGLTVRDLFGGEELLDLTGYEYFSVKVGDELKTITAMTIMQLLGEGGAGITYNEGDGINIEGSVISVDTEFVATKEDIIALNEKIENIEPSVGDIPDNAVTTSKIANGAVTEVKLSQDVKNSINNKAEKSLLDNYATKGEVINSQPTESVVESIETSLVSDALRKSKQHLTVDEKAQARANIEAQKELSLSVLDNGNIRISNLQGQTKDFMPATPSGDPMHYAYEVLGAVYNSGADVIAKTPWASLVDDADYNAKWGLNLIPDDATLVKTLKYNGADREVWQMKHPNKNFQIWVVAEYASDGTKIWDDTLMVKRGGMWYKDGLGDLTNTDMMMIINDPHPTKVEGSCAANKGRLLKFNNGNTNIDPIDRFLYANKNIDVWIRGFYQNFDYPGILHQAYVRHIVSSGGNSYYATINIDLDLPYISTSYMQAGKNITLKTPNISAKSIIKLINDTSATVTVTFPSALYDRLMDKSTPLGEELVALLESKSNIKFARGA